VSREAVGLVEQGYRLFAAGDIEGVLARTAPDIEWREPDNAPDGGVYHGQEEVRRHLEALHRAWDDFRIDVEELFELPGEQVLADVVVSGRGRTSGAEVVARLAHLWTIRDGLGAKMEVFLEREQAPRPG
jgi:uncharacterized protein